jgi:DNA-binding Xre family transcriptional regulator
MSKTGMFSVAKVKKRGVKFMISYKKLWHVLLDKDLKKKDLVAMAGVSTYTVNKLNKGENVTTDVLQKICRALDCDIADIMEMVPDAPEKTESNNEWTFKPTTR